MKELFTALIAARKAMPSPKQDGENTFFMKDGKPSKYVKRDEALEAIDPTAAEHGIAVVQRPIRSADGVGVGTMIIHESGEMLDLGEFLVRPAKDDPQGAVAATTYASRCALMLAFSLAGDDDDDGNGISDKKPNAANTAEKRQDAPQATKAPAKVSASAKPKSEPQNAANHSAAYKEFAKTLKAVVEGGVAQDVLKAKVLEFTKGKATSELTDTELGLLDAKVRHFYAAKLPANDRD